MYSWAQECETLSKTSGGICWLAVQTCVTTTFSPSKHDRTGSVTKVILVTKINLNFTADDEILFSDD